MAERLEGERKRQTLEQGLEAVLAIQDEGFRALALGSLTDWLEGERERQILEQGLEATLAIQDAGDRARALGSLISKLSTSDRLSALAKHLLSLKGDKREAVLHTLPMEVFSEPLVTQEIVAAIVGHVEEIRWGWRWL